LLFTALFINSSRFISQGTLGISQEESIITQLGILFFLVLFVVYLFGQKNTHIINSGIRNAILLISIILQIGISFRVSGLSGSRYQELLWAGTASDIEIIDEIVNYKNSTKETSSDEMRIGFIDVEIPDVFWFLRDMNINRLKDSHKHFDEYDVLFSQNNNLDIPSEVFFGQEFIINSFPLWSLEPIQNIGYYDYWSWLVFRRSQLYNITNRIWIKSINEN
jgi:hypothetical protein